jgi:hypothetical protein
MRPGVCSCHGFRYVYRGYGPARGEARVPGVRLAEVADRAGVSTGTASAVLNRPAAVPEATRLRVAAAIADLDYRRGVPAGDLAAHWRRNNFASRLFHPAATGRAATRSTRALRPVPVASTPFPGVPVRGRNAEGRADACWVPLGVGLTRHSMRHVYKTLMEVLGTPSKLMDAQMGHSDGSVQARYSHVTEGMRRRLLDGLTEVWQDALDARRALSPSSPVSALDRLLAARTAETGQ